MLTVRFRRDSRERLSSFLAEGHAGWAESGEDIVCAAVSAILQTAELGLTTYAKLALSVEKTTGRMAIHLPLGARDREDARAILGTAELAVEALAGQFPAHVAFGREPEPGEST